MAGKTESWLVWGVLGLMVVAGLAALALAPGGPAGTGPPGSNRPPTARFSPANLTVTVGDTVNFDASNSTDPDGSVKAFAWDFGDGATGTGGVVSHKYDITGALRVRLEVTDDRGAKNATTTNLWVDLVQSIPGAAATWNRYTPSVAANVTFPVDAGAKRVAVNIEVNTSAILGARAVATLLDPNGASVYSQNVTLTFGSVPTPIAFTVGEDNLTVTGQWSLKLEAQPADASAQVTVTIGFRGSVRVGYEP